MPTDTPKKLPSQPTSEGEDVNTFPHKTSGPVKWSPVHQTDNAAGITSKKPNQREPCDSDESQEKASIRPVEDSPPTHNSPSPNKGEKTLRLRSPIGEKSVEEDHELERG